MAELVFNKPLLMIAIAVVFQSRCRDSLRFKHGASAMKELQRIAENSYKRNLLYNAETIMNIDFFDLEDFDPEVRSMLFQSLQLDAPEFGLAYS
jgi:hypothetical protein